MAVIQNLKLSNFRCYSSARLTNVKRGLIVLYGPNGAGKTNVLEAVSILAPGRGLRGARMMEIQSQDSGDPWAVAADIDTPSGLVQLGTGLDPKTEKRTIRINGETARGQNALGEYVSCVWLTPQMDRLFLDSAGQRRRFLDRLIFAFDPGHTGRLTRYENAMSQRSKLLRDGKNEPSWLSSLESQMAETGVAISAARLDFIERLQAACEASENENFPLSHVHVNGTVETLLQNSPALEVEEMFAYQLQESRNRDAVTGGAATGPHKSDLVVKYAAKNMAADQCSTGEQKALLIGIVLAHARLIAAERGVPPILLLDEVAAHLDDGRRAALYSVLEDIGGQVWLTGTEENLFDAIKDKAQFFKIENADIQED